MRNRSQAPMRVAKIGYVLISIALVAAGALMIIMPQTLVSVIETFLGVTMVVFGAIKLVGYFSKDLFRLAFQYDLEFGILFLVVGIMALFKSQKMLEVICLAVGVCLIADALFKIRISLESKRFGIKVWWITTLFSILTAIFGIIMILRPSDAVNALMTIVGFALIAEGILNLCVAITLVKIVKNQKPDVIETHL